MTETAQQKYAKTTKGRTARRRASTKWSTNPKNREAINAGVRVKYRHQRDMLAVIKLKQGCVDCGYDMDAVALDFDHRDPSTKAFAISRMYGQRSDECMLSEVAKCDVRCANCHRIRTYNS